MDQSAAAYGSDHPNTLSHLTLAFHLRYITTQCLRSEFVSFQLITGLVDSLVAISPSLDHTSTRLFRLFFRGRMCGAQTVEAKRDDQIRKLVCVRANSRDSSQFLPLKKNP